MHPQWSLTSYLADLLIFTPKRSLRVSQANGVCCAVTWVDSPAAHLSKGTAKIQTIELKSLTDGNMKPGLTLVASLWQKQKTKILLFFCFLILPQHNQLSWRNTFAAWHSQKANGSTRGSVQAQVDLILLGSGRQHGRNLFKTLTFPDFLVPGVASRCRYPSIYICHRRENVIMMWETGSCFNHIFYSASSYQSPQSFCWPIAMLFAE